MVRCGHAVCCVLLSLVIFLRNATMIMQENVDPVCRLTCSFPRYLVCQYYIIFHQHPFSFIGYLRNRILHCTKAKLSIHSLHSFKGADKNDIIPQPEQKTSLILTLSKPAPAPAPHTGMLLFCFFVTDEALEARTAALRHRHLEVSR